jgi:hypothetical protein
MTRIIGVSQNSFPAAQQSFGGSLVDDDSADWYPANWSFYRRGDATVQDPNGWISLWPAASLQGGDPSAPLSAAVVQGWMNQWLHSGADGNNSQKFIVGTVKNAGGNAVSGAVVKAFLTSSDLEVGSCTSQADGHYECPTPYAGVNHYIVAYLGGGSPAAGSTVNTLTPTNRDGT